MDSGLIEEERRVNPTKFSIVAIKNGKTRTLWISNEI
jgi:hypothetical protein